MEIISYGGGIQTAALLVLTAQDKIHPRSTHSIFSDTGSELEATISHIEEVMKPYAERHGIEFVTVNNPTYGRLHEYQMEKKHLLIPMFGSCGGILNRQCTYKMKIAPVRRWLRSQGAKKAVVQLGISWDEVHRVRDSDVKWASNRFPLIDLRLTRADCESILSREGIPIPPKSACFMCPYRRVSSWTKLRENFPEEFARAVEFENHFEGEYLTKQGARLQQGLDKIIGEQMTMFEDDECGGYCWT